MAGWKSVFRKAMSTTAAAAVVLTAPSAMSTQVIVVTGQRPESSNDVSQALAGMRRSQDFNMMADSLVMNDADGTGQDELLAVKNPLTRPDTCNAGATQTTRETTSQQGPEARWTAAQQVFSVIYAVRGLSGVREALRGSPQVMDNGRLTPTFTFTYADGGKETFVVATLVPATLVVMSSLPGSLVTGSGEAKACTPA
jgi:hypothetical protein